MSDSDDDRKEEEKPEKKDDERSSDESESDIETKKVDDNDWMEIRDYAVDVKKQAHKHSVRLEKRIEKLEKSLRDIGTMMETQAQNVETLLARSNPNLSARSHHSRDSDTDARLPLSLRDHITNVGTRELTSADKKRISAVVISPICGSNDRKNRHLDALYIALWDKFRAVDVNAYAFLPENMAAFGREDSQMAQHVTSYIKNHQNFSLEDFLINTDKHFRVHNEASNARRAIHNLHMDNDEDAGAYITRFQTMFDETGDTDINVYADTFRDNLNETVANSIIAVEPNFYNKNFNWEEIHKLAQEAATRIRQVADQRKRRRASENPHDSKKAKVAYTGSDRNRSQERQPNRNSHSKSRSPQRTTIAPATPAISDTPPTPAPATPVSTTTQHTTPTRSTAGKNHFSGDPRQFLPASLSKYTILKDTKGAHALHPDIAKHWFESGRCSVCGSLEHNSNSPSCGGRRTFDKAWFEIKHVKALPPKEKHFRIILNNYVHDKGEKLADNKIHRYKAVIMIPGVNRHLEIEPFIDTGSEMNYIDTGVVTELGLVTEPIPGGPYRTVDVQGRTIAWVSKQVTLALAFGQHWEYVHFHVMQLDGMSGYLLGQDWIWRHNCDLRLNVWGYPTFDHDACKSHTYENLIIASNAFIQPDRLQSLIMPGKSRGENVRRLSHLNFPEKIVKKLWKIERNKLRLRKQNNDTNGDRRETKRESSPKDPPVDNGEKVSENLNFTDDKLQRCKLTNQQLPTPTATPLTSAVSNSELRPGPGQSYAQPLPGTGPATTTSAASPLMQEAPPLERKIKDNSKMSIISDKSRKRLYVVVKRDDGYTVGSFRDLVDGVPTARTLVIKKGEVSISVVPDVLQDASADDKLFAAYYWPGITEHVLGFTSKVQPSQETQGTPCNNKPPDPPSPPEIPPQYKKYAAAFSDGNVRVPKHDVTRDLHIELKEGKLPSMGPLYTMSEKELELVHDYVKDMTAKGLIRPSTSPCGAPILFARKKDGSLRLCVDYRRLNDLTVKNVYPLPRIDNLLDRMAGAKFFTKLDLKDAYWLIRIKEGDEWKTAFRTRYGLFEYLVMPFGLSNAPGNFQAHVNKCFSDMVDIFVQIYLDDFLIYSKTMEEHEIHVSRVLKRVIDRELQCNLKKCVFHADRVEFLGYEISANGVHMIHDRIDVIKTWLPPPDIKSLQSFLGFCNFYRGFIPRYSEITVPLTELTKKGTVYVWSDSCQRAFDELKLAFELDKVLHHF